MKHLHSATRAVSRALLLLSACSAAQAVPVAYGSSITWQTGLLAGTVSQGSFAYDSTLAATSATVWGPGMLTRLDFTLRGTTYDAMTANTGVVMFDAQGGLAAITFGSHCESVSCSVSAGKEDEWWFNWQATAGRAAFTGDAPGGLSTSHDLNLAPLASVPEPAGWVLMAAGLAALAGAIRRRTGSRRPAALV